MLRKIIFRTFVFAFCAALFFGTLVTWASDTTQMSQSISGTLDVAIVDEDGNSVANPSVVFPSKVFSMDYQTSAAVLGTTAERMRVTNPSGITDTWSLNIAATSGATAVWTSGTSSYDFNDATASAADGVDADSVGGQMTINPAVGTIAGVSGTSISNVSKGSQNTFVQGSVNSIDIMTASSGAQKPGQWDLIGVGLSQTIPAGQASGSYTIDMTLTAV